MMAECVGGTEAVSDGDVWSGDELEEGEIPDGDWHVLDQVGRPAATGPRCTARTASAEERRRADRRTHRRAHSGELLLLDGGVGWMGRG